MRARDRRLGQLRGAISAAPVLPHVLDDAYEGFWMFGELPEEDHVADAVLRKALRGGGEQETPSRRGVSINVVLSTAAEDMMTVREPLFEEALHESAYVRRMARCAIEVEVAYGGNVESPGFAARHGLPIFGTVGMHVLGYPGKWITPPYEFQGERLFTRWDELRARIDQRNPKWAEPIVEAMVTFRTKGELPKDDVVLGLVLADAELDQFRAHKKGHDVSEAMALFAKAARGEDDEPNEALKALCEMAAAGRLR
jgi:hypothetical protein